MRKLVSGAQSFAYSDSLGSVDALRGYAILLVICAHGAEYVSELVWPAKRLLSMGIYGVQLFFLASAVTLLMSWERSGERLQVKCPHFFIHRFLRIAPLYFLAIVFYWFVNHNTLKDFNPAILAATMLFYNAWSPYLVPTVNMWMPVPGGWSISVEFCFYFVFPLLAIAVTTLRRAIVFVVMGVIIMFIAARQGAHLYPEITQEQRSNFLYFWPFNHLVVFAIGFVLYQLLKLESVRQKITESKINTAVASLVLIVAIMILSFNEPHKSGLFGIFPTHLMISFCFMAWALIVIVKPDNLIVNQAVIAIGRVSFSVYILHFAMLGLASFLLRQLWALPTVGIWSVPYVSLLIALACLMTFAVAKLTYTFIEKPFIDLGKRITKGKVGRGPAFEARRDGVA